MRPYRIVPGPGQESVWDYPRPPRVERSPRHVQVVFRGVIIADTRQAWRVLETSHPPVYYFPVTEVRTEFLVPASGSTWCEFKGAARYFDVALMEWRVPRAAWSYDAPSPGYEPLQGAIAFYPGKMDRCMVDGTAVQVQPGDFYGGWITPDVVGPFKGDRGTEGW